MNDNPLEIFDDYFAKYNLSEEQKRKYLGDFYAVVIARVLNTGGAETTEADQHKIIQSVKDEKFDEALNVVKSKYSESDWGKLVKEVSEPVIDSYIEEVLEKK